MRPVGFSSGALAKGNYLRGIDLQNQEPRVTAIELSALRASELEPLVAESRSLQLDQFAYVSLHAPSQFQSLSEKEVLSFLERLPGAWPIVVHPDTITTVSRWQSLGSRLCLENMDLRKSTGRTVGELQALFDALPDAGFCLDLGHARQIDPTMGVAIELLRAFGRRLRQIHLSEVGTFGDHRPIGFLAKSAFKRVVRFIPSDTPIILESIVDESQMTRELDTAFELFAA